MKIYSVICTRSKNLNDVTRDLVSKLSSLPSKVMLMTNQKSIFSGYKKAFDKINPDDKVYDYSLSSKQTFKVVCDPKSLLYIYGMQLDFSKELIGGGFNFVNPNASQTCGCGSSFAV